MSLLGINNDIKIRNHSMKSVLFSMTYVGIFSKDLERAAGIEPASSAWKAEVIAIIRRTLNW